MKEIKQFCHSLHLKREKAYVDYIKGLSVICSHYMPNVMLKKRLNVKIFPLIQGKYSCSESSRSEHRKKIAAIFMQRELYI